MILKILDVVKQSGYFEVNYQITLDVPVAQQPALGGITIIKTAVAPYTNGTSVALIKADLAKKLNLAQASLNNDTTHQYYGIIFDGSNWSV